jgi:hypothetical protein
MFAVQSRPLAVIAASADGEEASALSTGAVTS